MNKIINKDTNKETVFQYNKVAYYIILILNTLVWPGIIGGSANKMVATITCVIYYIVMAGVFYGMKKQKIKPSHMELIVGILFYYEVFMYIQASGHGKGMAILIIFSALGILSLFNNLTVTIVGIICGEAVFLISYALYKNTVFSGYEVNILSTISLNYFMTGIFLIMGNRVALKDKKKISENAQELEGKNNTLFLYIDKIKDVIKTIGSTNHRVAQTIEELDEASNTINDSVHMFTANMEEQNASITEIGDSIIKINTGLTQLNEKAVQLSEESKYVQNILGSTVADSGVLFDNLGNIVVGVNKTKDTTQNVLNQIDNVKHIVSDIKTISEQTNMLSLNASIESARAGVHGLGFGVVANEIRNLADSSKSLAEGITNIIGDLCTQVENMVEDIRQIEERVSESEEIKVNVENGLQLFSNNVLNTLNATENVNHEVASLNQFSTTVKNTATELLEIINSNTNVLVEIQTSLINHGGNVKNVKMEIDELTKFSGELAAIVKE